MFFISLFKSSVFSKILVINFNFLITLFNNLCLLLNKLYLYNCYYIYNIVNVVWFLKNINYNIFNFYLSRKFNLFYQKKYLNILNDNYYKF